MSLSWLAFLPTYLRERWHSPSGYRDVLVLAGPLVLSTGTMTVQQFANRVFLTWYSPDALAASMPGGLLSFTILCFFIGTVSYANTFVAQYHGAGRGDRIPAAVWQAVYVSAIAGVLIIPLAFLAGPIFAWGGHAPAVQKLEADYFRILVLGGGFGIMSSAVSAFFIGLGHTRTVMWVNIATALTNVVLDYLLIFGKLGFPRLGIAGAGLATVISSMLGTGIFMGLFVWSRAGREYQVWARRQLDSDLLRRLLRFGAPSGLHFMLDILAWALFIMLVGRLGTNALGATNLAFQVNSLVFLPMIGFSIATATLVGHRLGENKPELAVKTTWSAFQMTFSYMALLALLYVLVPKLFLWPFAAGSDAAKFSEIEGTVIIMLRFVAVYSLFDGVNLIFSAALKGAGDTLFVMVLSSSLSLSLMVAPAWWICRDGKGSLWAAWTALTVFICVLAGCFLWRFLQGKWKSMRVTEMPHVPSSPTYPMPDHPLTDADVTAT